MTPFLRYPQTPERPIKVALIGDVDMRFVDHLSSFNIETIVLLPNRTIDPSIAAHADTQVFHAENGVLFADTAQCKLLQSTLPHADITPVTVAGAYPGDCKLNILQVGQTWFANTNTIAPALTAFAATHNIKLVHTKQGYTNCSAVAINDHAVLTDDASVAAAVKAEGFDVLQIQKGDIRLPGHAYGFIGGACAMIAPGHLLFFGSLCRHRDATAIETFLQNHGCTYHNLPDIPLTDIGSIVAIA